MTAFAHVYAVLIKQIKDSLKNRMILVIFFMFPILAVIFKSIVSENEFKSILPSFITMNTVMIPIVFMSSIVSEEKEKKSLRMLIMSNIKPWEYLVGVGCWVFIQAIVSSCLFILIIPVSINEGLVFILTAVIGIACSLIIGAIIAIVAKNQMSVGPVTAPISMILGLLPMFSSMNSDIEKIAKLFYSYYIRNTFVSLKYDLDAMSWLIIGLNLLVLITMFVLLYKCKGINDD